MKLVRELSDFTKINWQLEENPKYHCNKDEVKIVKGTKLLVPKLLFGIEIESEGWRCTSVQQEALGSWWVFKGDGSLRGDYAVEAVSYPMYGPRLTQGLKKYCDILKTTKNPFSFRCSTHLHMNVLNFPVEKLEALILLTLCADNFLFAAGDVGRAENYNCRPASLLGAEVEELAKVAALISHYKYNKAPGPLLGARNRYMGVNWAALWKFGTVEFRHFPGSKDYEELLRWINLCQRIYLFAKNSDVETIVDLVMMGIEEFGNTVFPNEFNKLRYKGDSDDWGEVVGLVMLFQQVRDACLVSKNNQANELLSFDATLRQRYVHMEDN